MHANSFGGTCNWPLKGGARLMEVAATAGGTVFSTAASLPYGPPVSTDIDYYRTFFRTCLFLQVLRG